MNGLSLPTLLSHIGAARERDGSLSLPLSSSDGMEMEEGDGNERRMKSYVISLSKSLVALLVSMVTASPFHFSLELPTSKLTCFTS